MADKKTETTQTKEKSESQPPPPPNPGRSVLGGFWQDRSDDRRR